MDNCKEARLFFEKTKNLPLLPKEEIEKTFHEMFEELGKIEKKVPLIKNDKPTVTLQEAFKDFHHYVLTFWFKIIKVDRLSVFQLPHRTNGGIERYHRAWKQMVATRPRTIKFLGKNSFIIINSKC